MNKILVYGSPHTGTSILRRLIGNHPDVCDFPYETPLAPDTIKTDEPNIVVKHPKSTLPEEFYKGTHRDYKIVMITKNPYDVFGSIFRRMGEERRDHHSVGDWTKHSELFLKLRRIRPVNVFTIKYEEIFNDGYNRLKQVFNFLKLEYSEDQIVHNDREAFVTRRCGYIPKKEPLRENHEEFRTWQMNQPITNMTGMSSFILSDKTKEILRDIPITKKLGYS